MGTQFQRTEAINAPDESDRFLLYGAGVAKPSFPSFFFLFLFFQTSSEVFVVLLLALFFFLTTTNQRNATTTLFRHRPLPTKRDPYEGKKAPRFFHFSFIFHVFVGCKARFHLCRNCVERSRTRNFTSSIVPPVLLPRLLILKTQPDPILASYNYSFLPPIYAERCCPT